MTTVKHSPANLRRLGPGMTTNQTDTVAAPLERSPVDYLNSDHQLPVPAIQAPNVVVARGVNTPGGINQYSPGAWLARLGGQSPIAWPRNVTTYSGPGS